MNDWLTLWRSSAFLAEATDWVDAALADADSPRRPTGPLIDKKVRFWSANYAVPTDAGLCWFKALCPAMAHEVGVVRYLDAHLAGVVLSPLAVDVDRAWMLNVDGGLTLSEALTPADQTAASPETATAHDVAGLAAAVDIVGGLQRRLEPHAKGLLDAGVPRLLPDDVEEYLTAEVDRLCALPTGHPAHMPAVSAREIVAGFAHARPDLNLLASSPIAPSLQHNDLHGRNIFAPGETHEGYRVFDWGDSVWSHPFAVMRVPTQLVRRAPDVDSHLDLNNPGVRQLYETYLAHWSDVGTVDDLAPLVRAADRLGRLSQYRVWAESLRDADHAALADEFDFIPNFEDQLRKVVRPRTLE